MPTANTIVINDGAASPVAKTFTRSIEGDGRTSFYERSAAVPLGFIKILFNVVQPKTQDGTTRIDIDVYYPTISLVGDKYVKSYYQASTQRHYLAGQASQAEIDNLLAFNGNLLLNTTVRTAFRNREGIFG